MKDIFEKKKAKITVKSPIHIGSVDQKLTTFEYIHFGQSIYQISEEKLSLFLQRKNLIDAYVNAVSGEGYRFKLLKFLKSKGITLKENDLIILSGGRKTKLLGDASGLNEYRPFIKDGFSDIFIPGTSIKGVIRTAILYNFLSTFKKTDSQGFQKVVEKKISNDIDFRKERRIKNKILFEWGIKKWLEGFSLPEFDERESPHTDWLRMLHVSDAYPIKEIETIIIPANVLKKDNSGWTYKKENSGQMTTIWIECIPENSAFEFTISWDKRLLEEFKRQNSTKVLPQGLEEVFDNINNWSKDVFEFEKSFSSGNDLQNWYKENKANFRIGFGSGMTSTTISILLTDEVRKKIRNFACRDKQNDIAPKSRRIWLKNNHLIPFGWAVMEVVG
ncbi:MAG: type III-A CRISPR-associated RAMP protein Csm5 [Nitrospirae bacterium]|nr:type III-A CRISPR-associated RAMP protein Csm5 [Nitrospirota bacterium]